MDCNTESEAPAAYAVTESDGGGRLTNGVSARLR